MASAIPGNGGIRGRAANSVNVLWRSHPLSRAGDITLKMGTHRASGYAFLSAFTASLAGKASDGKLNIKSGMTWAIHHQRGG
jgi:hypothetical protein